MDAFTGSLLCTTVNCCGGGFGGFSFSKRDDHPVVPEECVEESVRDDEAVREECVEKNVRDDEDKKDEDEQVAKAIREQEQVGRGRSMTTRFSINSGVVDGDDDQKSVDQAGHEAAMNLMSPLEARNDTVETTTPLIPPKSRHRSVSPSPRRWRGKNLSDYDITTPNDESYDDNRTDKLPSDDDATNLQSGNDESERQSDDGPAKLQSGNNEGECQSDDLQTDENGNEKVENDKDENDRHSADGVEKCQADAHENQCQSPTPPEMDPSDDLSESSRQHHYFVDSGSYVDSTGSTQKARGCGRRKTVQDSTQKSESDSTILNGSLDLTTTGSGSTLSGDSGTGVVNIIDNDDAESTLETVPEDDVVDKIIVLGEDGKLFSNAEVEGQKRPASKILKKNLKAISVAVYGKRISRHRFSRTKQGPFRRRASRKQVSGAPPRSVS
mmetsp:Transcript_8367/g.15423  ORF Transcript_8367/g.15423 Transcript_8367/m.15423 type:complete len:441 (+) Transcript_8367:92-1414(+)